mmetsp:Transcript_30277/g.45865  ORF Transcript_30277/g.45865 Transcript_30277/m.45865 type:complete len:95 (-) Transcript_30277:457-741(-)|eukprot:CAMPEP_0178909266 /NCGR_PEP_ID=MMETSP0786-20121207/8405_1 /TAXON_ID=186022 /ORGANISM="Thalassionema frauenfeldii, Strain CCMP 1798" /LENGTH=94 /DNA_ID=CAMNT_0020581305 /DNA_START=302 /DNA_END=589 /DNA_ORIENTATION=-
MANAGVADGSAQTIYSDKHHTVDVPCGSLSQALNYVFQSEPDVLEQFDLSRVFVEISWLKTKTICVVTTNPVPHEIGFDRYCKRRAILDLPVTI